MCRPILPLTEVLGGNSYSKTSNQSFGQDSSICSKGVKQMPVRGHNLRGSWTKLGAETPAASEQSESGDLVQAEQTQAVFLLSVRKRRM